MIAKIKILHVLLPFYSFILNQSFLCRTFCFNSVPDCVYMNNGSSSCFQATVVITLKAYNPVLRELHKLGNNCNTWEDFAVPWKPGYPIILRYARVFLERVISPRRHEPELIDPNIALVSSDVRLPETSLQLLESRRLDNPDRVNNQLVRFCFTTRALGHSIQRTF